MDTILSILEAIAWLAGVIAVFAAAAATFAMARPNISGAIAGVAIATALVPPVCAVGISLAHNFWLNAFGASTLFFTNLIAIIVTSSFTFSALGITASRVVTYERKLPPVIATTSSPISNPSTPSPTAAIVPSVWSRLRSSP